MAEKSRAAIEKKRYAKSKSKRIKAEADYKKKMADNPEYRKKQADRAKVHRAKDSGKLKAPTRVCPNCGAKMTRAEFHHTDYKSGKGEWRCPKCNPRGGAA
jgi:ribosomal protein S27AE